MQMPLSSSGWKGAWKFCGNVCVSISKQSPLYAGWIFPCHKTSKMIQYFLVIKMKKIFTKIKTTLSEYFFLICFIVPMLIVKVRTGITLAESKTIARFFVQQPFTENNFSMQQKYSSYFSLR